MFCPTHRCPCLRGPASLNTTTRRKNITHLLTTPRSVPHLIPFRFIYTHMNCWNTGLFTECPVLQEIMHCRLLCGFVFEATLCELTLSMKCLRSPQQSTTLQLSFKLEAVIVKHVLVSWIKKYDKMFSSKLITKQ